MDLLQTTKQLCQEYGIRPSRTMGQSFLIDENTYDKVVAAADLQSDDTVIEIGPGFGFLTERLAAKAGRVIAIELDKRLAEATGKRLAGFKNVCIIQGDAMGLQQEHGKWKMEDGKSKSIEFQGGGEVFPIEHRTSNIKHFKIVANLPYTITSAFIRKALTFDIKPSQMVLLLQKEVAERLTALPPDMSILAVSVQLYSDPMIMAAVPRELFYPVPAVDSAVVKFDKIGMKYPVEEEEFFRLVRIGFSVKRKMLKNNLANGYHISDILAKKLLMAVGLDEKVRAEALSLTDWFNLYGESRKLK